MHSGTAGTSTPRGGAQGGTGLQGFMPSLSAPARKVVDDADSPEQSPSRAKRMREVMGE